MPRAKRANVAPASRKTRTREADPSASASGDLVDEQLARYRSMRDFAVTAEPAGRTKKTAGSSSLPFCIQKHAASHLHYDFRLGWKGVLKSWACAKGPSYVVKDRRLAVQVEDHPIEYGGFEGIIPEGQYGGGTVMLWDQGTWTPQPGHEDVDAGLRDGQLKFTLDGAKLQGKWALIRMDSGRYANARKPNWLLIKEHDSFERSADAPAVTEAEPRSVVTGRSLEQIAAESDHTWNSKETQAAEQNNGQAWQRNLPAVKAARPRQMHGLDKLPKEMQPTFLKPQLCQENVDPPEGAAWIHELKLDGYRIQARKEGATVQMLTRTGLDWTERMRPLAAEIARLPADAVTLDGEAVVFAPDGTTSFADLQASMQEGARHPLTYSAFDLLHVDGRNPRQLPLLDRKKLLGELLLGADHDVLQVSEHVTGHGAELFSKACEHRAEGIVSKRADSPYCAGRGSSWRKAKCLHEQEFVIGGYTLPGGGKAGGPGLGALLLGYYDDGGDLIYAGRTGTGFTQRSSAETRAMLEGLAQTASPFKALSTEARRGAQFVRPERVAQVRFATWTADDQVRQAAFLGLREDKPARAVRRESAAPTPKGSKAVSAERKSSGGAAAGAAAKTAHASQKPADKASARASDEVSDEVSVKVSDKPSGKVSDQDPDKAPVRLTHPAKVLDPGSGMTKQQLADFYWAVSERMLPHIAGRPLSLVRLPDGLGKQTFYHKHVTTALPDGFLSVAVPDKKTGAVEQYIALSTREAIASLAQMAAMEVHPWGSRAADLEHPDRIVIDLDPDETLAWSVLTQAAEEVRRRLKKLGLESWVKTTGGKGLHVVFPIEPEQEWDAIKTWCHDFVVRMEKESPKRYLTKMSKAARAGKIFLDYLRNERGATAVAPYSPRAREFVGVAMPLAWSELKAAERPVFRVGNFAEWSGRLKKDPWAKLLTTRQHLPV